MVVSTLVIGIGNVLRGDDGVGPFVVELLREARPDGLELRTAQTVLPELADDMPGHQAVVFVDADLEAHAVTLRPVPTGGSSGLHRFAPAQVLNMARQLGFDGQAWICSLPVQSMGPGEPLSRTAVLGARRAAAMVLARLTTPPPPGPASSSSR